MGAKENIAEIIRERKKVADRVNEEFVRWTNLQKLGSFADLILEFSVK